MLRLSPFKHITIVLGCLGLSITLFIAIFDFSFNHKPNSYLVSQRSMSVRLSTLINEAIEKRQLNKIQSIMEEFKNENSEILTIGLREFNGNLVAQIGKHKNIWDNKSSSATKYTKVSIPIYNNNERWGTLEIQVDNYEKPFRFDIGIHPVILLLTIIAIVGLFLYHKLLKRSLRQLDPSSVIPERVKIALNVLTEGVLIVDEKQNIAFANASFSQKVKRSQKDLIGNKIEDLPWKTITDFKTKEPIYPWLDAFDRKETIKSIPVTLQIDDKTTRTFMANSAPIINYNERARGVLITFDDVTEIEKKNNQLQKMLSMLKKSQSEVKRKNIELAVLVNQDSLTGCLNRRAFHEIFNTACIEAKRTNTPLSCIMFDIDHFKLINDSYGHQTGDQVILTIAKTVHNMLRKGDAICRYGGEEFCLLLRNTKIDAAFKIAERMREVIVDLEFEGNKESDEKIKVTCSFGLSDLNKHCQTARTLIQHADEGMYLSKNSGRNMVSKYDKTAKMSEISNSEYEESDEDNILPFNKDSNSNKTNNFTTRNSFLNYIKETIIESNEYNTHFALLLLDINMFKRVNNTFGFSTGDKLLIEVAERIEIITRQSDTVKQVDKNIDIVANHLGGDEFVIIIKNLEGDEVIELIAQRIINSITEPYHIDNNDIFITCSVGISHFPRNGTSSDNLLQHAEMAMYHAKNKGKNIYTHYSETIDTSSRDLLKLEYDLHHALEKNQLIVSYQPIIDISTQAIAGLEALIRWKHPKLGIIEPSKFIPIAEETGLINPIGKWILNQACEQTKIWHDMGYDKLSVAVNLSLLQFKQADISEQIISAIENTGLNPSGLKVELTETALMENIELVITTLSKLHDYGIKISIDDFGIGYSSLNYLKRFPINTLKIDQSFVRNINAFTDDYAIITAIIALGHALNLDIIAEGVETEKQYIVLQQLKCDKVQGFYFSKPESAKVITDLLVSGVSRPSDLNNFEELRKKGSSES